MTLISGVCCFDGQDDGQIAISDEQKHRIIVFNADGTKKHIIGGKGTGNGEFMSPKNIATSTNGKLLVADSSSHRVQSFDSLGRIFQSKWQAHQYDIKKGRQPGEFDNPCGVSWVRPPESRVMEVVDTREVAANLGFEVKDSQFDGLDYGSDDDFDEPEMTPMHSFPAKDDESVDSATLAPHPDILIADTQNNRIQFIPDNAVEPPLVFGSSGEKIGQFTSPEDLAHHDGWSDWEALKNPACAAFRHDHRNVPYYYLGKASRTEVYDDMLENGKVGDFKIIETNQPNLWRMIHVTPESYKAADVEESVIKVRDNGFVVQGDTRNDGLPKFYTSIYALVIDGQKWLHLKVRKEDRHYERIAVCDTGNHRVQILGFIKPTYDKRNEFLLTLFPAKFVVLSVLGTGSKASGGRKCHLSYPNSCAYNTHGDLIVCDSGHWRVCIFAPDGEMVHSIGSREELADGPLGRPLVCNFGRDYVGQESVLIGYYEGVVVNSSVPPPAIKGDFGHLPLDATLKAFSYLDFRGAAQAAIACKLFYDIFSTLRSRWDLYPLNPSVFGRIKQIFVDWSTVDDGVRMKGHLRSSDPYKSETERGTNIEWWMENYRKGGDKNVKEKNDLSRQIQAENRRRELQKKERERLKKGGCKYKREDLNGDMVRNCSKMKDLKEMVRCLELTYTLNTDWRWVLMEENEEGIDADTLQRRKEKFIKYMLMQYMRPPVDETKIKSSGAFIDFENGLRCAICDLCGLPFWWKNEEILKIIFDSMSVEREVVDFDDMRTRKCETTRFKGSRTTRVMDYANFLDFMTTVAEKNMGLRDWLSHRGIQQWVRSNTRGTTLPKTRTSTIKEIHQKNATFDYQVSAAIGLVDRMFKRGQFEGTTRFPVVKNRGQVVDNEVQDDIFGRWERFR